MTLQKVAENPTLAATRAWSRRVRRVGGLIQLTFAAFWLVRGGLILGGTPGAAVAAGSVLVAVGVVGYGLHVTAGLAPRPTGPEAARIERAVTIATVVQLVASFAAPAAVLAVNRPSWVLPSIAVTIGPLLLWLDRRVDVPRYRPVGWALVIGPVLLVASLRGTALAATTGLGCGLLLLATAIAGFHDLGSSRPAS
jgi:hypothetical protein